MGEYVNQNFTPERAERYVRDTMPAVLARAAANMGEPSPDGVVLEEPNTEAARVSLLSAQEILDELGSLLTEDTLIPYRAALAQLSRTFTARYPDKPLRMPTNGTLLDAVNAAWEEVGTSSPATDGSAMPPTSGKGLPRGVGLPSRGTGLMFPR